MWGVLSLLTPFWFAFRSSLIIHMETKIGRTRMPSISLTFLSLFLSAHLWVSFYWVMLSRPTSVLNFHVLHAYFDLGSNSCFKSIYICVGLENLICSPTQSNHIRISNISYFIILFMQLF